MLIVWDYVNNENHKIIKFDEKPKYPKSTLASMGIYLFTDFLPYLIEDENDPNQIMILGKISFQNS